MRLDSTAILTILASLAFVAAAAAIEDVTVTLAWNANPEADLLGYQIYAGTESGQLAPLEFVAASPRPFIEIHDLTPGETYFFAVTAINDSDQESERSAELAYYVPNTWPSPIPFLTPPPPYPSPSPFGSPRPGPAPILEDSPPPSPSPVGSPRPGPVPNPEDPPLPEPLPIPPPPNPKPPSWE